MNSLHGAETTSPHSWMHWRDWRVGWRTHLVSRMTLSIGAVGVSLTLLFAIIAAPFIKQYETRRQIEHIEDLVTAVEHTASIAAFTGDQALAKELALGLLANPTVAGVRIDTESRVLVDVSPRHRTVEVGRTVRRRLASPFNEWEAVGEISVTADAQAILERASDGSRFFAALLLLEVGAITLLVALTTLRVVVKPIHHLASGLFQVHGRVGTHLPVPKGHECNEIGHLAHAFNTMIDEAGSLVLQAQALTIEIARNERRFRTLVENSPDIVARFDCNGAMVFANPACTRETGLATEPFSEATPIQQENWRPQMALEDFTSCLRQVVATGQPNTLHWEWETDVAPVCHEIHMVAEYDDDGHPIGVLVIGRNISARLHAERKLLHQATHDVLTGLPNRVLLRDRIQHAIARAKRAEGHGAVIFIDLDNFKNVNDSLGHDVGDELLKVVAQRMRAVVREGDTVARLAGDEFIILLESVQSNLDLDAVVSQVLDVICQPCDIAGLSLYPGASLGISVFPDDGAEPDILMRNADAAMYVAKGEGRHCYRFFSSSMNDELHEWMELSTSLRLAVANDEFEVHYQPKIDLESGQLAGMEALVRWRHPERGLVSPARFIPVAEKIGLIGAIGDCVLREVCRQLREWIDAGLSPSPVAVNLSAAQCRDGRLADHLKSVLMLHDLPGRYLEVEITESIVMNDAEESIKAFWALRGMGVQVAVDDFGTGYSSLSYLKRLPLDTLKIDKVFVDDIEHDVNDLEIVRAIIAMAHSLGLKVVAEGAETKAQVDLLQAAGCDQVQGYYFSRPLPAASMTARLMKTNTDSGSVPAQLRSINVAEVSAI